MWVYEKRLQYPVNITQTNAKLAQVIISLSLADLTENSLPPSAIFHSAIQCQTV